MFSGVAMFGFWGIVLGPVLMIVIVTTISVYLAVYKDAPVETLTRGARADDEEKRWRWRRWPWQRTKPSAVTEQETPLDHEKASATSDAS